MSQNPIVPAGELCREIRVENSRFIAYAAPAFSVEEARAFIEKVKTLHPTATHHVPAFIIGHEANVVEHCSDDGEPSGTAGRPALTVVRGSGIGDIVVVVVRYFGGKRLGTGGLVRAYTDAVKTVLNDLLLAEKLTTDLFQLTIPYSSFNLIQSLAESLNGKIITQDFSAEVTLKISFLPEKIPQFIESVKEITRDEARLEIIETGRISFLPVSKINYVNK